VTPLDIGFKGKGEARRERGKGRGKGEGRDRGGSERRTGIAHPLFSA